MHLDQKSILFLQLSSQVYPTLDIRPNGAIQILYGPGFRPRNETDLRIWRRLSIGHLSSGPAVNALILLYHGVRLQRALGGWCTTDPDGCSTSPISPQYAISHALPLKFHPAVIRIRMPAFEAPSGASVPFNKIARYRPIF
jgi:hypothetical protein